MFKVIAVLAVLLAPALAEFNLFNFQNETTLAGGANPAVTDLKLDAYLGLWYQMYADSFVTASFEKDAFCDTALYGARDDGKISVHNYAKKGSPTGEDYVIDGYAYSSNENVAGELKVHFDPTDGQKVAPFDAPYWILNLGPINSDGLYDWAIVSDNKSQFLFVLARDVKTFQTQYKEEVLDLLSKEGFKGTFKAPIETYQGDDCVYESNSKAAIKSTTA
jgi:lipocalin